MEICSIHQPNFFPWIGYWVKLVSSKKIILYDNCPLDEQGYSRRVKIDPTKGTSFWSSLELLPHKHGTALDVVGVNANQRNNRIFLKQLSSAYGSLPYFKAMYDMVQLGLDTLPSDLTVASYNAHYIRLICSKLELTTEIIQASSLSSYKAGQLMLIELCKLSQTTKYLSGCGAKAYLDKSLFNVNQVELTIINFGQIAKQVFKDEEIDQSILGIIAKYGFFELNRKLLQTKSLVLNQIDDPT